MNKLQWIILAVLALLVLLAIPLMGDVAKRSKCERAGGTWNHVSDHCVTGA